MQSEAEIVARRKAELETRYAALRARGLPTEKLEAEARQLLAYEKFVQGATVGVPPAAPAAQTLAGAAGGAPTILCCNCGVLTEVNDARLCLDCLQQKACLVDAIAETNTVVYCKACDRYEHKPQWLRCEWESKELLALCLKRIRKPKELRLVDAEFLWTEPHSRRIKLLIKVEGEVEKNLTVRQSKEVTFVVAVKQCEDCCKSVTPHVWVSNVQIRQRAEFKRSMIFLEQLILQHQAHKQAANVVDTPDGLDFHFLKPQNAATFVQFIRTSICCRVYPIATQLVGHDANSNVFRNKYTQIIEICPLNREDLVFLPKKVSQQLGGLPQIMLCSRVSGGIRLLDPFSAQIVDLDPEKAFRLTGINTLSGAGSGGAGGYSATSGGEGCLRSIMSSTSRNLHDFMILSVQPIDIERNRSLRVNEKVQMAEVELSRCSDLGKCDRIFTTVTHLGAHLNAGTIVSCYDLTVQNLPDNDPDLNAALEKLQFETIIVKKAKTKKRDISWEYFGTSPVAKATEQDQAAIQDDIEELCEALKQSTI